MKRLLVTGAGGQVGRGIVEMLQVDYVVTACTGGRSISATLPRRTSKGLEQISEKDLFEGPNREFDILVHASGAHPRAIPTPDVSSYVEANVVNVKRIFDYAVQARVKKLVFISTNIVPSPVSKADDLASTGVYSASKLFGEALLKDFYADIPDRTVLRLPIVISAATSDASFIGSLSRRLRTGEKVELVGANKKLEFLDVHAVVDVMRDVLRRDPVRDFSIEYPLARESLSLAEIAHSIAGYWKADTSRVVFKDAIDGSTQAADLRASKNIKLLKAPSSARDILLRYLDSVRAMDQESRTLEHGR